MSMKDLINKMTELQGTQESAEVVSTTGKKVLSESKTEVKESKPSLKGIFNEILNEAEQVTIQPAKQNTQVIKQGQKTLGTVENPQLAQQIKQSIGKGEMTLAGDELNEKWGEETKVAPSEKGKYEGKTKAELLKQYNALKAKGPHKKGSPDYGKMRELSFAIRAKSDWGKVAETDMGQADARKSTPSSKEEQAKVFAGHKERINKLKDEDKKESMAEGKLNEKAVSKSQQQAAGAALAAKRGDAPKSKLKGASKEMAKMSTKELKKFAGTKHKGLPDKKEKTDESSTGVRIVHNKLLGGWFIVRGPHQTPISGKFSSKEEAQQSLKKKEKLTANEAAFDNNIALEAKYDVTKDPLWKKLDPNKNTLMYKGEKHKVVKNADVAKHKADGWKIRTSLPAFTKAQSKQRKTDEAALPTHDGDFGAGLGAGRNSKTLESKKAKPDYIDLDKDGNKKESMKKAAADKQKKTKRMDESMNHNKLEAARLRGKAHALAKESYNCKYDEGTEERKAYHDGFKEGLDECYGMMPIQGLVVGEEMPATVPGMASNAMPAMEADMEEGNAFTAALARTPKGGNFTVGGKTFTDRTGYDAKVDEMDMMAFEAWDRQLNELLNEGKMKDLDMDLGNAKGEPALSDAKFKEKYGKTKAEMKKSLSSDSKNKTPVKEGISVSVSKGQQGSPDSVTVSAQDQDADALLAMIKQAGLGLFGGSDQPQTGSYGAPVTQAAVAAPQGGDVGDHDSMMSLIKKVSGGNDYEDEESQDAEQGDSTCPGCGSSDCGCDDESDSKAVVVGEEETEDQMEFEVSEANAPDSDEKETTADEDAEAEEDKALAGQNSSEQEVDEEKELNEWANDAGYTGSENTQDNTFEQDIEFMTRVISGGLNGPKQDQTTLPHTKVKVAESDSISDWKKLSGIK